MYLYMLVNVKFQILYLHILHMYNIEIWTNLGGEAVGEVLEQGVGVWAQTLALASLGHH